MTHLTARLGEGISIGRGLEVVVMQLEPCHVKLGIRQVCTDMHDLFQLACTRRHRCHAYYRSGASGTMLVVRPLYGQTLQLFEGISLQAVRVTPDSVCLFSTNTDRCDTPSRNRHSWPLPSAAGDERVATLEVEGIPRMSAGPHPPFHGLPRGRTVPR